MGSVGISTETGMLGAKPLLKGDDGVDVTLTPVLDCSVPLNQQTGPYYPRLLAPSLLNATSSVTSNTASGELNAEHAEGTTARGGARAVLSVSPVEKEHGLLRGSEESTPREEEGVVVGREGAEMSNGRTPHKMDLEPFSRTRESPDIRIPEVITCRDNMLRREKHELDARRIETAQNKRILEKSPTVPPPLARVPPPSSSSSSSSSCSSISSSSSSSISSSSSSRVPLGAVQHFKKRGSMSPLQRCCDILCMVWPLVLVLSVGVGVGVGAGPGDQGGDDEGVGRGSDSSIALQGGSNNSNQSPRISSSSSRPLKDPAGPVSGPDPPPLCRIRVTDGWWWCDAALDCELSKLLEKVPRLLCVSLLSLTSLCKNILHLLYLRSVLTHFIHGNYCPALLLNCCAPALCTVR